MTRTLDPTTFAQPDTRVLSCDLDFDDFLRRTACAPRAEVYVWSETELVTHLYDEETERLLPIAAAARAGRRRRPTRYQFTDRQVAIAREAMERARLAGRPW